MIGYLEGKVVFKGERYIILDVSGVGYKIFINTETSAKIPFAEEKTKIWTHLHQREDAIELYGFSLPAELNFFETLIGVPGVGPRTALGITNVAPLDMLKHAIASGELSYLTKVSGIGRKTAEKIMVELREKFGKASPEGPLLKEERDALEALESLGYSLREAREALQKIPSEVEGTSARVREALKMLGKHSS
ncbi:Holliday junction branch migration protein RuvA [Candidatus Giovannonibacteria bacterium]|nr:Holliday junction branch migration protein RuvA [Candidatus Giovannonibacteria bacterium]